MKAPTSLFDRPGRATAVAGAVIAVSATAAVALASGTAAADEPGRCTTNVNVRSEPDTASRIVALCEAGTEVQVGESRAGFVRLTNLGGWAAQEYVSVNGEPPAPAERATAGAVDSEGEDAESRGSGEGGESSSSDDGGGSDGSDDDSEDSGDSGDSAGSAAGSGGGQGGRGGLAGLAH
jgi:hypothetical protein